MNKIGQIKTSKELGYKGHNKLIWAACIDCGKPRWVKAQNGTPLKCKKCGHKGVHAKFKVERRGEGNPNWKGGRYKHRQGYMEIRLQPEDFFFPMASYNHLVKEHRLVMAKHLGRCLQPWEEVHHKNGIKDDNRLDNLELTTKGSHTIMHSKGYRDGYQKGLYDAHEARIRQLETRVTLLEAENVRLETLLFNIDEATIHYT